MPKLQKSLNPVPHRKRSGPHARDPSAAEGISAQEIRTRLRILGLSIAKLAEILRRSPAFIHQVLHRERRSAPVERAITSLLARQGLTSAEIWGVLARPEIVELAEENTAHTKENPDEV